MSDDRSPRLSLPFLIAGQAQKEITHNEALQLVDALVQPVVQTADLAMPPASPEVGKCWIVGMGATGEWAGHDGAIGQWTSGGWRFSDPLVGWRCHVVDRGTAMIHDGAAWQDDLVNTDGIYIDGDKVIGARSMAIPAPAGGTVIDNECRLAINELLAMLRTHGMIES